MEMEPQRLPKLNFKVITLAIALGLITAGIIYQVQNNNWLNFDKFESPIPSIPPQEFRTILKEESAVIDVVEKTSPSVVAIGVSRRIVNPFDPFATVQRQDSTIGTGFVVSEKGIIVTNKHVVSEPNDTYSVVTTDEQKYNVLKIYRDPVLDLAILQVDAVGLKPLELGDSSKIKVGQMAIAIGNALGRFTNTVTTGVVSGVGRKVVAGDPFSGTSENLDNLIQTDAAINPGNSGGPLLNSAGQVIAVNVATTEGAQNIGFAVPINSVKAIVNEFIQTGNVTRPFLGIRYKYITKDLSVLNEVPQGAYIQEVVEGGPAEKAGLQVQDIITKINGQAVDSENKIAEVIQKGKTGDQIKLRVWREGTEIDITATLLNLPAQ